MLFWGMGDEGSERRAVDAVVREVVVADDEEEHVPEAEHEQLEVHPPGGDETAAQRWEKEVPTGGVEDWECSGGGQDVRCRAESGYFEAGRGRTGA